MKFAYSVVFLFILCRIDRTLGDIDEDGTIDGTVFSEQDGQASLMTVASLVDALLWLSLVLEETIDVISVNIHIKSNDAYRFRKLPEIDIKQIVSDYFEFVVLIFEIVLDDPVVPYIDRIAERKLEEVLL